jgi:hypothetical protein
LSCGAQNKRFEREGETFSRELAAAVANFAENATFSLQAEAQLAETGGVRSPPSEEA